MRDVNRVVSQFEKYDFVERAGLAGMNMGQGVAEIDLYAPDDLYDKILMEIVGVEIRGKDPFAAIDAGIQYAKKEYDTYKEGLEMVKKTGYWNRRTSA